MNQRPVHIWLIIVLTLAFGINSLFAIGMLASDIVRAGLSPRAILAYVPALLFASIPILAGVALFMRKAWVRWLYLLGALGPAYQLLLTAPYLFLAATKISDLPAKAAVAYMVGAGLQALLMCVVTTVVVIAVFRYFRRERLARDGRPLRSD